MGDEDDRNEAPLYPMGGEDDRNKATFLPIDTRNEPIFGANGY
jgi:hypothetical protein